jgi:hypothetical protein
MPKNFEHSVDIERDLDDERLSQVRFGRSRFLRILGIGLFGLAAGLASTQEAEARPASKPPSCGVSPECRGCRGAKCEGKHCRPFDGGCTGDGDGEHCWTSTEERTDGSGCYDVYKCCDYRQKGDPCHCRKYVGKQC